MREGYVYILSNKNNDVLYVGVTSDIVKRIWEHKNKVTDGFTSRYNVTKLVYYECYNNIETPIVRENQIKGGSRKKKIDLVESVNKDWIDLYPDIIK
ncbi:GIY-YIG nuclease family protein [Seleniivibrio woodruffii]|uniref:GIY-YIG nuclease family protein n=1 Tax=Seleniivibrio woodruffii TaxID=1078050 RepID=UPI00240957A5|nr:GIY-YIG nuclease family protein [Seleniivibrio woodruffii]